MKRNLLAFPQKSKLFAAINLTVDLIKQPTGNTKITEKPTNVLKNTGKGNKKTKNQHHKDHQLKMLHQQVKVTSPKKVTIIISKDQLQSEGFDNGKK